MIKLVLSLAVILFTTASLFAQCPPGYTDVEHEYWIGNCKYWVKMCVKCSITGLEPTSIIVRSIENVFQDVDCSYPDMDMLRSKIEGSMSELCTISPCTGDCYSAIEYNFYMPVCMSWHSNVWYVNGVMKQYHWLETCEGACHVVQRLCYDNNLKITVKCGPETKVPENVNCTGPRLTTPNFPNGTPAFSNASGPCFEAFSCP